MVEILVVVFASVKRPKIVTESLAIQFVNQWQIEAVVVAGQFASQENGEKQSRRKSCSRWKVCGDVGNGKNPAERYVCTGSIYLGPSLHFPNRFLVLVAINCLQFWQLAKVAADTLPHLFFFFLYFVWFSHFFFFASDSGRSCSSDCISLANNSDSGWHFLHKLVNMKILH